MKKLTAFLLAMLMLVLPFGTLAEDNADAFDFSAFLAQEEATDLITRALENGRRVTNTIYLKDVSETFTDDPAVDEVIADVLNALVLTGYSQGEESGFAFSMKQESGEVADLLTGAWALAGEDAYISTNLLGGTIVISEPEVVPVMQRLVDMFVMLGLFEKEEAEQIKAEMPEIWETFKDEFATAFDAVTTMENVDPMTLNYSALTSLADSLKEKVTVGEMDILPRNCDTATSMITVTLTADDVKNILISCIQFIKDNPVLADYIALEMQYEQTIAPEMAGMTDEQVDFYGFLDKAIEEIRNEEFLQGDIVARIWLGEDSLPVAAEVVMPIENGEETADLTVNYTRLTMNEMVAHSILMKAPDTDMTVNIVDKGENATITLALAAESKTVLDMTIDFADNSTEDMDAFTAVIDMAVTEEDYSYADDTTKDVTTAIKLTIDGQTVTKGVDFEQKVAVKVAVNEKEYLTICFDTVTSDPVDSIINAGAVRPAQLNDNDFANWFVSAYMSLYTWAENLLMVMPASLMNLMTTAY